MYNAVLLGRRPVTSCVEGHGNSTVRALLERKIFCFFSVLRIVLLLLPNATIIQYRRERARREQTIWSESEPAEVNAMLMLDLVMMLDRQERDVVQVSYMFVAKEFKHPRP